MSGRACRGTRRRRRYACAFDVGGVIARPIICLRGFLAGSAGGDVGPVELPGVARRAKQARGPNGRVPFGYRRDQDKQSVRQR